MSGRSKAGISSGRPSKRGQKSGRPGLIVRPGKRTKTAHPGKQNNPIGIASSSSSDRSSSRKAKQGDRSTNADPFVKRKSNKERHATSKIKSPAKHTASAQKKLYAKTKPSPNTTSEQYIHPFTSSETGFQNVRVEKERGSKGKQSAELSVKVSAVKDSSGARLASRSHISENDAQRAYPVSQVTSPSIGQFQAPPSQISSGFDSQVKYGDPPGSHSRKDSPGRYGQKESPGRYAPEPPERYGEQKSPAKYAPEPQERYVERKSPARYAPEPQERYVERKSPARYAPEPQERYVERESPARYPQGAGPGRYQDQSRYLRDPPARRQSPLQNQCESPMERQYRQQCLCVPQECLPPMVVVPDHCTTAIGQVDVDSITRTRPSDRYKANDPNREFTKPVLMKDDFDYNRAYEEKRSRLSLCREYLEKKRREKIKQICKDKSEGRAKKPLVCIDKNGQERFIVDVQAEQKKLPVCKDKTEPQKYEVKQLKTSPATRKEQPRKVEPTSTKKLEKPKVAEKSEILQSKSSSSKAPLVVKKTQSRSQSMTRVPSKSSKSKSSLARTKSRSTSKGILSRPKKWSNKEKVMVGTAAVALLLALSAFGLYYYDMLDFE